VRPRPLRASFHPLLGASVLAISLAGCSSSSTGPNAQLTSAQVQTIGASVATEIESSLILMTPGAATTAAPAPRWVLGARGVAPGVSATMQWSAVPSCPTVTPYPFLDSDGDGVPDNVQLSFTLPACSFTDANGTLEVTGTLGVSDPQPQTAGLTATATATQLRDVILDASNVQVLAITHNGSWSVAASSNGVLESYGVNTVVEVQGRAPVTITNAWLGGFTPAQGAALSLGEPLPAGTLTAAGGFSLSDGTNAFVLTLDTSTPLSYDPVTCAGQPSSLTAGEVHATLNSAGPKGYLSVQWTNCAAPTYVFVATG